MIRKLFFFSFCFGGAISAARSQKTTQEAITLTRRYLYLASTFVHGSVCKHVDRGAVVFVEGVGSDLFFSVIVSLYVLLLRPGTHPAS